MFRRGAAKARLPAKSKPAWDGKRLKEGKAQGIRMKGQRG
jgi:hypothetical protein